MPRDNINESELPPALKGVTSAGIQAVYVIGPRDGYPVKIGLSDNPVARAGELQGGCWERLYVHSAYLVFSQRSTGEFSGQGKAGSVAARDLETATHRKLRGLGVGMEGEWFSICSEDAEKTIQKIADYEGMRIAPCEKIFDIDFDLLQSSFDKLAYSRFAKMAGGVLEDRKLLTGPQE